MYNEFMMQYVLPSVDDESVGEQLLSNGSPHLCDTCGKKFTSVRLEQYLNWGVLLS